MVKRLSILSKWLSLAPCSLGSRGCERQSSDAS